MSSAHCHVVSSILWKLPSDIDETSRQRWPAEANSSWLDVGDNKCLLLSCKFANLCGRSNSRSSWVAHLPSSSNLTVISFRMRLTSTACTEYSFVPIRHHQFSLQPCHLHREFVTSHRILPPLAVVAVLALKLLAFCWLAGPCDNSVHINKKQKLHREKSSGHRFEGLGAHH